MSQGFKLRYDQLREGNPTTPQPELPQPSPDPPHETGGYVRNLCLVWVDGRKMFFNYAYLVAAEFHPEGDKNEIVLNFSGHLVSLKGYSLELLFAELFDHSPRMVLAVDPRYATGHDARESVVIEIQVAKPE